MLSEQSKSRYVCHRLTMLRPGASWRIECDVDVSHRWRGMRYVGGAFTPGRPGALGTGPWLLAAFALLAVSLRRQVAAARPNLPGGVPGRAWAGVLRARRRCGHRPRPPRAPRCRGGPSRLRICGLRLWRALVRQKRRGGCADDARMRSRVTPPAPRPAPPAALRHCATATTAWAYPPPATR